MGANYFQYMIKETDKDGLIMVYNDAGWARVHNEFATVHDIIDMYRCSRSTAYRLLKTLPHYEVEDYRIPSETHQFTMVKRSDLATYNRTVAGNPNFANPDYQRQLAKRPRKKKVDK